MLDVPARIIALLYPIRAPANRSRLPSEFAS
jgi:hypothetical protein